MMGVPLGGRNDVVLAIPRDASKRVVSRFERPHQTHLRCASKAGQQNLRSVSNNALQKEREVETVFECWKN